MPRRRLSAEEIELWRRVTESASRLRDDLTLPAAPEIAAASAPAAQPEPAPRLRSLKSAVRPAPAPGGGVTLDLARDPHAALDRPHPHMDRRRFEKLRRGRLAPEARLDLHGMTAERAHAALNAFVSQAQATGLRLILVITGKGRTGDDDAHAPHRRGVLRHSVPHWLSAPPLALKVLQVAPAHIRHGGGGAYYVYLRRPR